MNRDVETAGTYYRHCRYTRTLLLLEHYVAGHMIVSQRLRLYRSQFVDDQRNLFFDDRH